jgi:hypothetical protein
LHQAENDRTAALVYRTEVEALRQKLEAKEIQVIDLSSELSQRKQELRVKDRRRKKPSHSETSCKSCSKLDVLDIEIRFY